VCVCVCVHVCLYVHAHTYVGIQVHRCALVLFVLCLLYTLLPPCLCTSMFVLQVWINLVHLKSSLICLRTFKGGDVSHTRESAGIDWVVSIQSVLKHSQDETFTILHFSSYCEQPGFDVTQDPSPNFQSFRFASTASIIDNFLVPNRSY
jgi:hypothetical protein